MSEKINVIPAFQNLSKDEFVKKIGDHQFHVVFGCPGEKLPSLLHSAGFKSIVSSQIRRKVAIALADQVAEELGTTVGSLVGYGVLDDEKASEETQIKFVTDGILLREVKSDPELKKYSTIILDQAQEKTENTQALIEEMKKIAMKRSDIKILVLANGAKSFCL